MRIPVFKVGNKKFVSRRFCEGVSIRSFTSDEMSAARPSADDWVNTNMSLYRWNIAKEKLLEVDLDEPAFLGFKFGAPDIYNSIKPILTTHRMNCIECHTTEFHGAHSIFSLRKN